MIQEQFVPYELAVKLKELGFIPIYHFMEYDTEGCLQQKGLLTSHNLSYVIAPLWQQVFDYFREKHKLRGDVKHAESNGGYTYTIWKWNYDNLVGKWERIGILNSWGEYSVTQKACLEKLIKIVENENHKNIN